MTNQLLLSALILIVSVEIIAQDDDFDNEHIESSLSNFSRIHANIEYYRFNENEQAVYFLANGNIEFGNSDYLNIELVSALYVKEEDLGYTMGDFNLSYTKNFYSKQYQDPGFQGLSPTIKMILPTGNASYSGLFGQWILEPAVYYSWLLSDEKFFISNRWRLFYLLSTFEVLQNHHNLFVSNLGLVMKIKKSGSRLQPIADIYITKKNSCSFFEVT